MMKKERAFSLAELLISLLVTSMVLAATVPTVTRKMASTNENIWRMTNSADPYAATNDRQKVIIGNSEDRFIGDDNPKLSIVKPAGNDSSFLSFYTKNNDLSKNPILSGRIYADDSNLGMGVGVFNKFSNAKNNVAFGQNSLLSIKNGISNIAIGNNALKYIEGGFNSANKDIGNYNVAIGTNALTFNTNGNKNTAIGHQALYYSLGGSNTAIGFEALVGNKDEGSNNNGNANTATGYRALKSNLGGHHNTAMGYSSLGNTKKGNYNVAIGSYALSQPNDRAYIENTAIGFNSMSKDKEIEDDDKNNANKPLLVFTDTGGITSTSIKSAGNVAIGSYSLSSITEGSANVAIGRGAQRNITTGSANVAIGYETMTTGKTGVGNIAIGTKALHKNGRLDENGNEISPRSYNIAIGYESLANNSGQYSNAIGYQSLATNPGDNNNAFGFQALYNNLSGSENNAIGYQALYKNKGSYNNAFGRYALWQSKITKEQSNSSTQNNAFGDQALKNNIEGSYNSAFGDDAMISNQKGSYNVAIGNNALYNNISGNYNVAMGSGAIEYMKYGKNNVGIGYNTLQGTSSSDKNKIPENNVAIGTNALKSITTGKSNIAIGTNALTSATTGAYNIALGEDSLKGMLSQYNVGIGYKTLSSSTQGINTWGGNNIAIGYMALSALDGAGWNTAIGPNALKDYKGEVDSAGNPGANTAIGSGSMFKHKTGALNVAIGADSLYNSDTGSGNIAIGYRGGFNVTSAKNTICIGSSCENRDNYVGIGSILEGVAGNAIVRATPQTSSDIRLKNILGDSKAGLEEINKIHVVNFNYKKDEKKTTRVGVIAQELQKIFPNSVMKDKEGFLSITQDEMFYAMINSIKELCAKILGLDKRISELEKQNKLLEEKLEKQNIEFSKRLEKLEAKNK